MQNIPHTSDKRGAKDGIMVFIERIKAPLKTQAKMILYMIFSIFINQIMIL